MLKDLELVAIVSDNDASECFKQEMFLDYLRGCGGEVAHNQTYIQSPGWPDSYAISEDQTCTYTFKRISSLVCQVQWLTKIYI